LWPGTRLGGAGKKARPARHRGSITMPARVRRSAALGLYVLLRLLACASAGAHMPQCEWPAPLYPQASALPGSTGHVLATLAKLQAFQEAREDVVVYLVSGGLLGLYRDGQLIPGDSDVDLRFAVRGRDPLVEQQLRDVVVFDEPHERDIALNDLYAWGDTWNPIYPILPHNAARTSPLKSGTSFLGQISSYATMDDRVFADVKARLCRPPGGGIATHNAARAELEFNYGPQWFIKMPWKGQDLALWPAWAQPSNQAHSYWTRTLDVIRSMDLDANGRISTHEVDVHVAGANIDPAQYAEQITARDRCRAAAMLTFMLAYAEAPHVLRDQDGAASTLKRPQMAAGSRAHTWLIRSYIAHSLTHASFAHTCLIRSQSNVRNCPLRSYMHVCYQCTLYAHVHTCLFFSLCLATHLRHD